jgi:hypothetical protein
MIQFLLETSFVSGHPGVILYNVLQVNYIFALYDGEMKSPMPYSKFAHEFVAKSEKKELMLSSRIGMLIIYVPAMITALVYLLVLPLFFESVNPSLAGWMLAAHFIKRNLEVLFLHKYSGSTAFNVVSFIGTFYALISFMICSVAVEESSEFCSLLGKGGYRRRGASNRLLLPCVLTYNLVFLPHLLL